MRRRSKWLRCTAGGPNLAVGQAIELFSLGMLSEDFCSSRRVTGQHAGGQIECLTGSIDRMRPICHRAPALSSPARNGRVMDLAACTPSDDVREHQQHDHHERHSEQPKNDRHIRLHFPTASIIPASKDSSIYLRHAGDVTKDVCLGPVADNLSLRNSFFMSDLSTACDRVPKEPEMHRVEGGGAKRRGQLRTGRQSI